MAVSFNKNSPESNSVWPAFKSPKGGIFFSFYSRNSMFVNENPRDRQREPSHPQHRGVDRLSGNGKISRRFRPRWDET
jgi:hypothetical protein